jgi:hypothetical protein
MDVYTCDEQDGFGHACDRIIAWNFPPFVSILEPASHETATVALGAVGL